MPFAISLAFPTIMVGSTQNQLCIFQKARKNESYVIEAPFSNVYLFPFLHSLNHLWIIAFSLKTFSEGGFSVAFGFSFSIQTPGFRIFFVNTSSLIHLFSSKDSL